MKMKQNPKLTNFINRGSSFQEFNKLQQCSLKMYNIYIASLFLYIKYSKMLFTSYLNFDSILFRSDGLIYRLHFILNFEQIIFVTFHELEFKTRVMFNEIKLDLKLTLTRN